MRITFARRTANLSLFFGLIVNTNENYNRYRVDVIIHVKYALIPINHNYIFSFGTLRR